jgi:hypothetical protein
MLLQKNWVQKQNMKYMKVKKYDPKEKKNKILNMEETQKKEERMVMVMMMIVDLKGNKRVGNKELKIHQTIYLSTGLQLKKGIKEVIEKRKRKKNEKKRS